MMICLRLRATSDDLLKAEGGGGMGKGRGLRSEDGGLSMCAEVESFVPVKMAISVLFLPYETARGMGIHVSVP